MAASCGFWERPRVAPRPEASGLGATRATCFGRLARVGHELACDERSRTAPCRSRTPSLVFPEGKVLPALDLQRLDDVSHFCVLHSIAVKDWSEWFWNHPVALAVTFVAPLIAVVAFGIQAKDPLEKQAYASFTIVIATVILIFITAMYAESTREMADIMKRDLEVRVQPRLMARLKRPHLESMLLQVVNLSGIGVWIGQARISVELVKDAKPGIYELIIEDVVPAYSAKTFELHRGVQTALTNAEPKEQPRDRVSFLLQSQVSYLAHRSQGSIATGRYKMIMAHGNSESLDPVEDLPFPD